MEELDDKIASVICSCKTVDQLNVAHRYVKLALKGNLIGQRRYYFMWGVITALKGILNNKQPDQ